MNPKCPVCGSEETEHNTGKTGACWKCHIGFSAFDPDPKEEPKKEIEDYTSYFDWSDYVY